MLYSNSTLSKDHTHRLTKHDIASLLCDVVPCNIDGVGGLKSDFIDALTLLLR